MDVEDIQPGQNFAQTIDRWIGDCSAVLVVIGPRWLDCLHLRLKAKQRDYVAHEIEVALARKITVIPVLVGGASVNELTSLPPALADLSLRQAVELRDATFKEDFDRLAISLGLPGAAAGEIPARPSPLKHAGVWAGAFTGLIVLLLLANWIGIGPGHAYRERSIRVEQLLRTAEAQSALTEYESAFKTYQEALRLESTNRIARNRQVDAAMLWAENFHMLLREDQKAEDVAGPPLAEIMSALYAGLARTNGHDARAADILAHLGWAHWLNEHIASKEFGRSAEQGMRQALSIEPANVYANAMLGNWLLQKGRSFEEAVRLFEVAVKTGKQRPFVRKLQLSGFLSNDDARSRTELSKAANEMRIGAEPLTDYYRRRLLRYYDPGSGFRNGELERTLSAVPSSDSWATFLWLDNEPEEGGNLDKRRMVREIVHACLARIDGKPSEALALLKIVQNETKRKGYSGSISDEVDLLIKNLTPKSAAQITLRERGPLDF